MKTLAEVTAPRQVERKILEADIQKRCVDWARERGYWARKLSTQWQAALPDYIFARGRYDRGDGGICKPLKFACEFKRPGNRPTDSQVEEMAAMEAAGWEVFWCDNFEEFRRAVLGFEKDNRW